MQGLDQAIKTGTFSKAYLLYGDEDYLKTFYKRKLCSSICDTDDTMNFTRYEGKGIEVNAVIDQAETLPFFRERRLILIENSGFFKGACDELASYLSEPCDTTCFVFAENEVDKRSRMYKAVAKLGSCVEMTPLTEDKLLSWAAGILKRHGKQVRKTTLLRLFERSGTDMNSLKNELEKLVDYTGSRTAIEDDDVDAVCTVELKNKIFDMVDAITERRTRRAFSLYYDLLSLKEPPLRILYMISRQYNLLLQVKELSATQRDPKLLASKTGLAPFIVKKYLTRCSSYQTDTLRRALDYCVGLEQAAKSGRLDDKLSVELLISKKYN